MIGVGRRGCSRGLLDLEAFVAERDALDGDLVGVRLQAHARVLLGPRVDDGVRHDRVELVVHHRDGAVLAGFLELAVDDHLAPVPQRLVLIDAALELDIAPLGVAHRLDHIGAPVGQRPLDLGDLGLGVEARRLLEEPRSLGTADVEGEPNWDMCFLVIGRHPGLSFLRELPTQLTDEPSPPLNCERRKTTNSAGFTGAMPISQMTWPASMTSGGLVSESHLTKKASCGVEPNSAPSFQVRVRKFETAIRSWIHSFSSLGSNTLHCVPSMIDSAM